MVLHVCEVCKMEFDQKCNFTRHLSRKNPCKQNIIIIDENPLENTQSTQNHSILNENPHKNHNINNNDDINNINDLESHIISCKFCNKIFTRKDALKRHVDNYCKLKKEKETIETTMLQKIEELVQKNKIMEEEINNLKLKKTKTTNNPQQNIIINNNGVINNTNNTNNINIANFGTLDNKKIGNKIFFHTLTNFSGLKTLLKFIEFVHKNNKLKEYQNVEITDLGRNLGRICTNNEWAMEDANIISDKIIDESYNYYELKFDELEDEIDEKPQQDKNKIKRNKRFIFTMKGSDMFEMNDDGDYVDDDGNKVTQTDFKNGRKFEEKLKKQVKLMLKK